MILVGVTKAVPAELTDFSFWTLINSTICACNMAATDFKNLVSSKGGVVVGACAEEAEEEDTVAFYLRLALPFCGGFSSVVSAAVVAGGCCTTSSSSSVAPPLVWLVSASFI